MTYLHATSNWVLLCGCRFLHTVVDEILATAKKNQGGRSPLCVNNCVASVDVDCSRYITCTYIPLFPTTLSLWLICVCGLYTGCTVKTAELVENVIGGHM